MNEKKNALQEKIKSANIPLWVKEYICSLERERQTAINALNQYVDSQTPAPFFINELESTGEETGPSKKVRYVQSHKMEVKHAGVLLCILLRDGKIDLQWESDSYGHDIALIPRSYHCADLVAKENMQ